MRTSTILVSLAVVAIAFAACKKKEEGTPSSKGAGAAAKTTEAAAPSAPAPVGPVWTAIPLLGLTLETPGPGEVSDTSADAPNASVLAGNVSIDVSTVTVAYPSTFEAAKADVQKDPNPFKRFTKEEKRDGGWYLEYELESMIDKSPLYGVQIRTTIEGKQYQCGRNDRDQANRDTVARACLSLKKAP
jgi:hypothetical protein